MPYVVRGILAVLGRILICTIFFMSAAGNKIPNFHAVAKVLEAKGIPAAPIMLVGAIVFLIVGSLSVVVGYKARIGATLLLIFLVLATYFFHAFWKETDPKAAQEQMIQLMKNLSMMGAMLLIIANGPGPFSVDERAVPKGEVGVNA